MSRGGEHRRRHLVQQRLELVVVVLVDQRDVDVVVLREGPGAGDAGEAAADDDDPGRRGVSLSSRLLLAAVSGASSCGPFGLVAAPDRGRAMVGVDVDPAAAEGVEAAPAARDVEQLEVADARRQRRIDDEVVAERLEAEHRPQQQQRRAGRPGLRAAGRRVLDRVPRQRRGRSRRTPRAAGPRRPRRRRGCPAAIRAASSLNPYRRRPQAMNELSNGQTVPRW